MNTKSKNAWNGHWHTGMMHENHKSIANTHKWTSSIENGMKTSIKTGEKSSFISNN